MYKIAQNHTSEGFLWSGEISVDGKNFDKDYGLTFSDENGRHVFGSFAKELIFSASNSANYANYAENYDEQANLEITLTCIDEDKGIYTEKKIDYQTVEKYDEPLNDEEQIDEDTSTQEETDTEMLAEETQEDTSSNDNSAADNSSEQKEQPKKSSGGRTVCRGQKEA